jgi:hypothetical protein
MSAHKAWIFDLDNTRRQPLVAVEANARSALCRNHNTLD